jgi:hypothetical protein
MTTDGQLHGPRRTDQGGGTAGGVIRVIVRRSLVWAARFASLKASYVIGGFYFVLLNFLLQIPIPSTIQQAPSRTGWRPLSGGVQDA